MDATGLRVWLKIIGQVRNWLLTWTSEGWFLTLVTNRFLT
jgi:hypothetical protein